MDTLRSFSSPTTSIYDPDVTSLVARSERNPGLGWVGPSRNCDPQALASACGEHASLCE
jgi:hypothetical protein